MNPRNDHLGDDFPEPHMGHERQVTTDGIICALFWWAVIIVGVMAAAAVLA